MQDYGSIVLIDERYTWQTNRSQISRWLRDRIKIWQASDELGTSLHMFYAEMETRGFIPKVEQLAQV